MRRSDADVRGLPSRSSWFSQRRISLPQMNGSGSDPYNYLYLNLASPEFPSPTDSMRRNSATSEHTDSWRGLSTAAHGRYARIRAICRTVSFVGARSSPAACLLAASWLFYSSHAQLQPCLRLVPGANGVQSTGVASRRCTYTLGVWPTCPMRK